MIGNANAAIVPTTTMSRDHFHCPYRMTWNMAGLLTARRAKTPEELDEAILQIEIDDMERTDA